MLCEKCDVLWWYGGLHNAILDDLSIACGETRARASEHDVQAFGSGDRGRVRSLIHGTIIHNHKVLYFLPQFTC